MAKTKKSEVKETSNEVVVTVTVGTQPNQLANNVQADDEEIKVILDCMRGHKETISTAKDAYKKLEDRAIAIAERNPQWFVEEKNGKQVPCYTKHFKSGLNSAGLYKIVSTLASATFSFIDDKTSEGRKNIFNYLKDHLDTVKISLINSQMQEFSAEELEKWEIQKTEYEREFKVTV